MNEMLGPRLRAVRESQKLSLRSVATSIGVSPSLLSQVETGKTQPSVSTLYMLVNHLGVSIDDLLASGATPPPPAPDAPPQENAAVTPSVETPGDQPVQRASENPVIEMENGVVWERMAVGPTHTVDPLIVTYAPGASSSIEGKMMRHAGVEYAYLLSGELTLRLDFATYVLGPGDSLCFDSVRPHMFYNHTSEPARGIWFVVGRREFLEQWDVKSEGSGELLPGQVP
ncbi:cupin domain-containing protein [Herbiconiux daphne]|uniref:Cupin domain-containing protein n=1 Tax=Herbiconiux daphne TaxID=2970914 RepID=A0ABT2H5G8_9MICO|nr:cupin domain-containing protein [Herbiconiux daphne]MCS5735171.1 cupin domain-containing protein [Herbiconiux daphne]